MFVVLINKDMICQADVEEPGPLEYTNQKL